MRLAFCLLFTLLISIMPFSPAHASPEVQMSEGLCMVMVIDDSGSMKTNDPSFLRYQGASLFISLLDDADRVGIVHFSGAANSSTSELVRQVDPALTDSLKPLPPDGFTDFLAALQAASNLLEKSSCQSNLRRVVLLTDGKPELSGGIPPDYDEKVLDQARSLAAPIMGIALTPQGESSLLHSLAAQVEGGKVIPAHQAGDLLDAYLQVLALLKDRTVMGSGAVSLPDSIGFYLDPALTPYLQRVVFVAAGNEGLQANLIGPDGKPVLGQGFYLVDSDSGFSTFVIDHPVAGKWQVNLTGKGRATVRAVLHSRLRLAFFRPETWHALGDVLQVEARVLEEDFQGRQTTLIGEAVISARLEMPDGSQIALDQLYDDGTHGDRLSGDGIFTASFPAPQLPGYYSLRLQGSKGMVPLSASTGIWVEAFPQLIVDQPVLAQMEYQEMPLVLNAHFAGGDGDAFEGLPELAAKIISPDGSVENLELHPVGSAWQTAFTPRMDGLHHFEILAHFVYRGLQLEQMVERDAALKRIPQISILKKNLDLGMIEKASLKLGVDVPIALSLDAFQPETLTLNLEGFPPGLEIAETVLHLQPGDNNLQFRLKGEIPEGSYAGQIALTADESAWMEQRAIPVQIKIIQPMLRIRPAAASLEVREDQLPLVLSIPLSLDLEAGQGERLKLTWQGYSAIQPATNSLLILPGQAQAVQVPLKVPAGVPVGRYSGLLLLQGRPGLDMEPGQMEVMVVIRPVSFLERWGSRLAGMGLAIPLAVWGWWIFRRSQPRPTGRLRLVHGPAGGMQLGAEIRLAERAGGLFSRQVLFGAAPECHIHLSGPGILPRHAVLKSGVIQVSNHKFPGARPLPQRAVLVENLGEGMVRVGCQLVTRGTSVPLHSGDRLALAGFEFEYLF